MMPRWLVLAALCACAPSTREAQPEPPRVTATPQSPIDRLVADVCDKDIVLLGEADHGDGTTWQHKAALVQRLVERCGFDAVLVESGIYDFLALEHAIADGTATAGSMANAVGAVWSGATETQTWIEFLDASARSGTLRVGGLDDQVHSTAFYAQQRLPAVLAGALSGPRRTECESTILRHTTWSYDDTHPYSAESHAALLGCLTQIDAALRDATAEPHAMARSLRSAVAREQGMEGLAVANDRDASMFANFQWHRARLGDRSKVIVWCATIHAAKDLAQIEPLRGLTPLGQHLRREYGDRVAAIGFTARAGASQSRGREPRVLEAAPAGSLEARAGTDALRYLDAQELAALGPIDARPLGHVFHRAQWDQILDGLVVLDREEPAHHTGTRDGSPN